MLGIAMQIIYEIYDFFLAKMEFDWD